MNGQIPTIIVVTYERLQATQRCLDAVFKHTPSPIRLIIIDNNSRSEVKNYLQGQPGMKLYLDQNLGLYKALNLGMRLVDQELVAFLDCDIVVTPGWWDALASEVSRDPQVG